MKKNLLLFILLSFSVGAFAQDFGYFASAVNLSVNFNLAYYSTDDTTDANEIGSLHYSGSLGSFSQNSGLLAIAGGLIKTFKNSNSNVCGTTLYYTVYPQGPRPSDPFYTAIHFNFLSNCQGSSFPIDGSACSAGDQQWGDTSSTNLTDLTTLAPGNYTMEVYYEIPGAYNSTSSCGDTIYDNNNNPATNYFANFTILSQAFAVKLVDFSAAYQNTGVALKWSVENEINEKVFEVERSTDNKNFTAIGTINPKNNYQGQASYSYLDNSPTTANTIFYRLKMTGNDGKFIYSPVVAVNTSTSNTTAITAQLTSSNLSMHLGIATSGKSILKLTDMLGRVILTKNLAAQEANSSITIPLSKPVLSGVYTLSIYDGLTGNTLIKKLEPAL